MNNIQTRAEKKSNKHPLQAIEVSISVNLVHRKIWEQNENIQHSAIVNRFAVVSMVQCKLFDFGQVQSSMSVWINISCNLLVFTLPSSSALTMCLCAIVTLSRFAHLYAIEACMQIDWANLSRQFGWRFDKHTNKKKPTDILRIPRGAFSSCLVSVLLLIIIIVLDGLMLYISFVLCIVFSVEIEWQNHQIILHKSKIADGLSEQMHFQQASATIFATTHNINCRHRNSNRDRICDEITMKEGRGKRVESQALS